MPPLKSNLVFSIPRCVCQILCGDFCQQCQSAPQGRYRPVDVWLCHTEESIWFPIRRIPWVICSSFCPPKLHKNVGFGRFTSQKTVRPIRPHVMVRLVLNVKGLCLSWLRISKVYKHCFNQKLQPQSVEKKSEVQWFSYLKLFKSISNSQRFWDGIGWSVKAFMVKKSRSQLISVDSKGSINFCSFPSRWQGFVQDLYTRSMFNYMLILWWETTQPNKIWKNNWPNSNLLLEGTPTNIPTRWFQL